MAFLGGLQGLGSLAGGVEQGIGQGLNLNQYLQQQQAQNLAGNILSQAYGGGQPSTGGGGLLGGLSSLFGGFGGGQQASASPTSQPLGGLGAAGQTPVQPSVPGIAPGQPGTATLPTNLFGGGAQQAALGMSQMTMPQPTLAQPQQAQPQGDQGASQQTQPFDVSQRMGGGQQQMTLPQFVQMVRKVAPNANGRQVMMAAQELGRGGLLGFGGITPYQAAELQLRMGANDREWAALLNTIQHGQATERYQQSREKHADIVEARTGAFQRMEIAGKTLDRAERALNDVQSRIATSTDDDQKAELKKQVDALEKARDRAQKAYDAAEKEYQAGGESAGGGGGPSSGGEPDYVTTPEGKMMHYKGSGPRNDPSSYEEVQ